MYCMHADDGCGIPPIAQEKLTIKYNSHTHLILSLNRFSQINSSTCSTWGVESIHQIKLDLLMFTLQNSPRTTGRVRCLKKGHWFISLVNDQPRPEEIVLTMAEASKFLTWVICVQRVFLQMRPKIMQLRKLGFAASAKIHSKTTVQTLRISSVLLNQNS